MINSIAGGYYTIQHIPSLFINPVVFCSNTLYQSLKQVGDVVTQDIFFKTLSIVCRRYSSSLQVEEVKGFVCMWAA